MRLLLRSTDPVLVGFATSLLRDAGIEAVVFDQNVSTVEGGIGIFPRRLMVADAQWVEARGLLRDAGLAAELAIEPDDASTE